MKIINREEFLEMPPNTIYSKFSPPFHMEPMEIKCGTIKPNDFYRVRINDAIVSTGSVEHISILQKSYQEGLSFGIDFVTNISRDGLFDGDDDVCKFVVWEADDIRKLLKKLTDCLVTAGANEKKGY